MFIIEMMKDSLNLRKAFREVVAVIRQHGWKIGAVVAAIELTDHFILPAVLFYFNLNVLAGIATVTPISELAVYPVVAVVIGKKFF